ncbi:MAG TPA: protein-L-isoaspartate(D-aspartate) O-methyltransferase, partial [Phycisphaerae bacterium]|nr:protein-L-isoaspartate(D-aspartate) O-methyltransferase [Phycisphaerae bacterium]
MFLFIAPACREPAISTGPPNTRPTTAASVLEPPGQPTATTQPSPATQPRHPRTSERASERAEMVRTQIAARSIKSPTVLDAMRNVPRHWFVPASSAAHAYEDHPLPIGHGQTISQPYIVALMTEALDLKPGDKVLEIGTGSGYQAAVLSELTDRIYTIEIVEPLGRQAIELFRERGYDTIHVRIGDGYRGWPEAAPFDAIIVTCAPDEPPPELVKELAVGGRMCIPVGGAWLGQELVLLTKQPDGSLKREM